VKKAEVDVREKKSLSGTYGTFLTKKKKKKKKPQKRTPKKTPRAGALTYLNNIKVQRRRLNLTASQDKGEACSRGENMPDMVSHLIKFERAYKGKKMQDREAELFETGFRPENWNVMKK